MRDRADLHLHSSVSDGLHSPTELVVRGAKVGLGGIALTDHDALDGNEEFLRCDAPESLERVPGVEISTEHKGMEIHLLGYFVRWSPSSLKTRLRHMEAVRRERFPKMVRRLGALGIVVTQDEIDDELQDVMSPGRPHLARILVRKGVVENVQEAFDKYLASAKPAYVPKERMETVEAINLLIDMAAVPVIAHPLMIHTADIHELLSELQSKGLEGVETEYDYGEVPTHGTVESLRALTQKLGLIETGGSDYHGDPSHAQIGEVTIPVHAIRLLRKAHERLRKP